jgi:hypothetical protein
MAVEDGGIDHAAAGDFDPTGFFALGFEFHVDLEAGLGEGEEVRAEADFGLPGRRVSRKKYSSVPLRSARRDVLAT